MTTQTALSITGLAMMAITAALAVANPAWHDIDTTQTVANGDFTRVLGENFDKKLVIREPSVSAWATASYVLFGEARRGAIVGTDGWLYTEEEFTASDPAAGVQHSLAFARAMKAQLQAKGIDLVVVLVPAKTRIHPEHLGDIRWPAKFAPVYDTLKNGLERAGIPVVDVRSAMKSTNDSGAMFFRTDTHWTPTATKLAAQATANAIFRVRPALAVGAGEWTLVIGRPVKHDGDLLTYLPLSGAAASIKPASDMRIPVSVNGGGESDLLGDASTPIVLVGTSYSANPKWGFDSYLKAAVRQDVVNAAQEGDGPFVPLAQAVGGRTLEDANAQVVIWELPERYTWMTDRLGPPGTNKERKTP